MAKNRKGNDGQGKIVGIILLVLAYLAVIVAVLLRGNNIALFNAKGLIAHEQMNLMLISVGIMLIIAVPVLFMLYFFAWKYRESNHKAKRNPDTGHGKLLNAGMWLVPGAFMVVLAMIMWPATHRLDPKKEIASNTKPLTIQVVALRWKWLFIYPEQKIATVNYVQMPTNTSVRFLLTGDEAPMSAFWIPNLGGMLYAMNGHVNELNLMATTPGEYPGSTAEINGAGFAGMKFTANATSQKEFDAWAAATKLSSSVLNTTEYNRLLKPSEDNKEAAYSVTNDDLYATVVMKYMGPGGHQHGAHK